MLTHWIDWAGQAGAALLWFISVLVHGRYEAHDVLQMLASLSWLTAMFGRLVNMSTAATQESTKMESAPMRPTVPLGVSFVL